MVGQHHGNPSSWPSGIHSFDARDLLKLPVHRLDGRVAAVIGRGALDRIEPLLDRGGQLLERRQPATLGPAWLCNQMSGGVLDSLVLPSAGMDHARRQGQLQRLSVLDYRVVKPVHRGGLPFDPSHWVPAHPTRQPTPPVVLGAK
jgi:hypothetical protein